MNRFVRLLISACLFVLTVAPLRAADGPVAVIEALNKTLLQTLQQSSGTTAATRYDRLKSPVSDAYNFARMISIIAGSAWTNATPEQQEALLNAFARFSVANYASRFKGYSGEEFEIVGTRPGVRDTTLVETRLVRTGGEPAVPITYVFEEEDSRWRIIDVLLERSISELALRRSEYAQTLRSGGIEALTTILNSKADEMLAS